jgi:protein O-mannosyl-transferase
MHRSLLIALALLALTGLALGRVRGNEFVDWDDTLFISTNAHFNPPTYAGLGWYWTHPHRDLYIPVTDTLWWSLAALTGGTNPVVFHAANLLLHWLAAMTSFTILRRLVGADWPAAAGAALFAVHPLQVEPVAWASGMKDLLSGLLGLAALWNYLRFAQSRSRPTYCAASALYALALLAKPSAVIVPLIAAVLEWLKTGNSWRRSLAWLWPWVAAAAITAIAAGVIQPATSINAGSAWARPLVAADAIAFYLRKLFWPLSVAPDYDRTPMSVLHAQWHGVPVAAITWIVPGAVALLIASRGSRPIKAAAVVFGIGLLPMLGLRPFEYQFYSTVADHYVYLAMLGPALAAAWLLSQCATRAVAVGAVCVLAGLATLSFIDAGYWHDTETLYRHEIAAVPTDFHAPHDLGVMLADRGDVAGAMEQYERVIELNPDLPKPYRYVADAQAAMGNWPAATDYAQRLILLQDRLAPADRSDPAELHHWLGGIFLRWGQSVAANQASQALIAYQRAVGELDESLRIHPNDAGVQAQLRKALEESQSLKPNATPRPPRQSAS